MSLRPYITTLRDFLKGFLATLLSHFVCIESDLTRKLLPFSLSFLSLKEAGGFQKLKLSQVM